MNPHILAIDQSTSATKAMLFDRSGRLVHRESLPHAQYYPMPGYVEHDGEEIYANTLAVMKLCVNNSGIAQSELACLAITNQRETVIIWHRGTGKPICYAAVWQCLRGSQICSELQEHSLLVHQKTGLMLDPYFSASKLKWMLDNTPGARAMAESGDLLFGTMDSWLVWKLTGGKKHITDYSNASRTLLFNINSLQWDPELFAIFDIPESMAPELTAADVVVGATTEGNPFSREVPIAGLLGDSHAALFGEGCFEPGSVKATYGTGSSIMMNIGPEPQLHQSGIVTSVGYGLASGTVYALEGNIHCSGVTIQWLKEDIELIKDSAEASALSLALESTEGVYLVPAFTGLGAPYWDNDARAIICGMSRSTRKAHIVRAAEESIAYQGADLLEAFQELTSVSISMLHVDGAPTRDEFLMQFQADILGIPVCCAPLEEVSALGSAFAAGLAVGVWVDLNAVSALGEPGKLFQPKMGRKERQLLRNGWKQAVARARLPSLDQGGAKIE